MASLKLQRQSWVVVTETINIKPKIFIIWPFPKNICQSLSIVSMVAPKVWSLTSSTDTTREHVRNAVLESHLKPTESDVTEWGTGICFTTPQVILILTTVWETIVIYTMIPDNLRGFKYLPCKWQWLLHQALLCSKFLFSTNYQIVPPESSFSHPTNPFSTLSVG